MHERGAPYDTMWWIGQDTAAVAAECPAEKRFISHHVFGCTVQVGSRHLFQRMGVPAEDNAGVCFWTRG